jgi:hypothetical protein
MTFTAMLVGEVFKLSGTDFGILRKEVGKSIGLSRETQAMCKLSRGTGYRRYNASQLRTRLSKARHDKPLRFRLANELLAREEVLSVERGKYSVLHSLWNEILLVAPH